MSMHTMSDEERAKYKAAKLKEMRDYNADFIDDLGISIYDFNMKMQFYDEQGRLVVGIFPSEFKKTKGFYFELIDSDLNPIDPERKIYRIPPSNSFEEEYELNAKGSYLVPIDEIRVVNRTSTAIVKSAIIENTYFNTEEKKTPPVIFKAPSPIEDAPYAEMTIRDYYAIQTGKPVSCKNWLNDLIKSTK